MRLNHLLAVATVQSPTPPPTTLVPPVMADDAVDRILAMADAPTTNQNDTSPTNGRPLFVRLPGGDIPMVHGHQLRALVDKLGLAIMPDGYVNAAVRGGDTEPTRAAVAKFKQMLGTSNDFYVVAPVEAVDPAAMINDDTDRPVYVAPSERATYRSMFMMVPMLRGIVRRVNRLEERVAVVEDGVREVRRELGRMASERAAAQARSEEQRAMWALSRDPMIIAVPKGTDPASAEMVLAGPAWGPEFSADELRALGIVAPAQSVANELSPLLAKVAG